MPPARAATASTSPRLKSLHLRNEFSSFVRRSSTVIVWSRAVGRLVVCPGSEASGSSLVGGIRQLASPGGPHFDEMVRSRQRLRLPQDGSGSAGKGGIYGNW